MSDKLLVEGIAALLNTAGVGTWDPSGVYAAGQTGIYSRRIPSDRDAGIALSTYTVSDDPTLSDSITGLQIVGRTAGHDPRTTDDLMDAIFDQLHGLPPTTLSTGVRIQTCERRSGVSLGQDDLKRWSTSNNYYIGLWRPSPNRT